MVIGPAPPWVEELALPDSTAPPEGVRYGRYDLLRDHQVRVGAGPTADYLRRAWRILSPSGVENGSEVRIEWDPSYQRLTLHRVRLLREGREVNALSRGDVKVIQQEGDLDQRIYNGSLTALVFLKDVRPGDIVDYAFTREGQNPILDGRFVARMDLAYDTPVARLRHVIRWPAGRTLHVKAHLWDGPPTVRADGEGRTYVWDRKDVPPVVVEDRIPRWFDPYPSAQAGEFASWGEVARWAARVFETQKRASPALKELAATWRSKTGSDEERALEAIRFVQDQVRYLGIEIGPSSHQPHPPDQVLSQRFGDCKDKALLLAALLAELGIEAHPALVDTSTRRTLDEWQPSPFAFDHAIVMARIGPQGFWIDATRSGQGGRLATLDPLPYERALVLRSDTEGLTSIPVAPDAEPRMLVEESYVVKDYAAPVRLEVRTTYRSGEADAMRSELATTGRSDFAQRYLNFYAQDDPTIRALAPPRFEDDRERNVLVASESYEIPAFWKGKTRDFDGWAINDALHKPQIRLRTMPLRVEHPVYVRQVQTIDLPEALDVDNDHAEVTDPAFRFRWSCQPAGKRITLTYTYQSLKDWVPAPDVRKHLAAMGRVRNALSFEIDRGARRSAEGLGAWLGLGLLGFLGMAGTALGVVRLLAWRRRSSFRRLTQPRAGTTPANPRRVRHSDDIDRLLAGRTCRCGGSAWTDPERETFAYDGRPMTVATQRCAGCGVQEHLYFVVGTTG